MVERRGEGELRGAETECFSGGLSVIHSTPGS